MERRPIFALIAAFLLLAPTASAQGLVDKTAAPKTRLEGTYLLTATMTSAQGCDNTGCVPLDPLPPFKVLLTFAAGASADEGILVDTSEFQLVPNPVCTPDQGSWKRTGKNQFVATHLDFCFDATANYSPAGLSKVRDEITIASSGHLSGRQYVEGFDPSGTLVYVAELTIDGNKVQAEAPPSSH